MKTMYLPSISIRLAFLLLLTFLGGQARANVHTWIGGNSNGLWSSVANWAGGLPTQDSSAPVVIEFGSNTTSVCDVNLTVNELHFTGGGNTIIGDNNLGNKLTLDSSASLVNLQNDGGTSAQPNVLGGSTTQTTLRVVLSGSSLAVNIAAGSTLNISAIVSGDAPVDINGGAGTIMLTGANTFSGQVNLESGTLVLNTPGTASSIVSSLLIGSGATARLGQSDVIGDVASITVNLGGLLDLGPFSDTIGSLTVNGTVTLGSKTVVGNVTTGPGTLTTNASLTVNAGGEVDVGGGTLTCNDPLSVNGLITLGTTGATVTNGTLNVNQSLAMAGGAITGDYFTKNAPDVVNLNGDVTATSNPTTGRSATITAFVTLNGTVNAPAGVRSFSVAAGTYPEFIINGPLTEGSVVGSGMIKRDTGTMRIVSALPNNFTGVTTVDKGTLELNNSGGLAIAGSLVLGNGSDPANSAILRDLADFQMLNDISRPPTINKSGQLDLNNHRETFPTLSGLGTIALGDGTAGSYTFGGQAATTGGVFTFGGDNGGSSWGGVISGQGSFVKDGTGVFNFTGTSTSTGAMDIKAGRIQLNSVSSSLAASKTVVVGPGTGPITVDSFTSNPALELQRNAQLPDTCTVVVNPDGFFTVGGFTDSLGTLTINNGLVDITSGHLTVLSGLNMTAGTILATTSGTLILASDVVASASATTASLINAPIVLSTTPKITVNAGAVQPALRLTGAIGGAQGLTKTGMGTLVMADGPNPSATNNYSGPTTVDQGLMTLNRNAGRCIIGPVVVGNAADAANTAVLQALQAGQYGTSVGFTVNASGKFDLSNRNEAIASLAGPGGSVTMGTGNLTVGSAATSEYDGAITGTGNLVKTGSGSLTLGGINPYSGTTSVSAGSLLVNGALQNSPVTVSSGATLGGAGTVPSVTAAAANAAVLPGLLAGGSLQVAGSMTLNPGGKLSIGIDDSTAQKSNRLAVAGALTIGTGALNVTTAGTLTQGAYVIASYGSLSGSFVNPTLPSGYSLTYTYSFSGTAPGQNIAIYVPVLTSPATNVSAGAATLNGTATLNGPAATAHFEYGTTTSYGTSTTPQPLGNGYYSVPLTADLSTLTPATVYHFRLVVTTGSVDTQGADQTFTTSNAPVAVTLAATTVTANAAKLNGTINPGGNPGGKAASYYFEYGLTTAYGTQTLPPKTGLTGSTDLPVSAALTGLYGGRTYHFRLVGTFGIAGNLYYGADFSFTTPGPFVATLPATAVAALSATANGTVNPRGKPTTAYFEYGLTATSGVQVYGLKTAVQSLGSGSAAVSVTGALKPLSFGKSYTYRIVATSADGVSRGDPQTFSTLAVVKPNITTQPVAKLAALGSPVTFTVAVTEVVPTDSVPTYQWRKNGVAVAGATAATYAIPAVTLAQAGSYDCVIKNASSTIPANIATSNAVPLGVMDASPKTLNLAFNTTATMTASNAGTGLVFTWTKGTGGSATPVVSDGIRITKAGGTVTIKLLKAGDAGTGDSDIYTCQVGGSAYGMQTLSAVFTLKVFNSAPAFLMNPVVMPEGIVSGTYNGSGYQIPVDPSSTKVPTSYDATGLPAGLTVNKVTGFISGKPTVASKKVANVYQSFPVILKAINSIGSASVSATLIVTPLPTLAVGTFNGLVDRDANLGLTSGYGGKITISVLPTGTFTGNLGLGALAYPLTGVLNSTDASTTATASVTVKRTAPATPLTLTLTISGDTGKLTGSVTDGVSPVALSGWVNPWTVAASGNVPAALATKYTAVLETKDPALTGLDPMTTPPGNPENAKYPQGNGFTSVAIATNGTVTWVGKMADGVVPATYSTTMGPDGSIPVHLMLYVNTGSAHGVVKATADGPVGSQTNGGLAMLDGTVDWNKTAQPVASKDLIYKAGIPKHDLTVQGGAYVAPAAKTPVLGVTDTGVVTSTNARLLFTDGGIKDVAATMDLPFVKGSAMASSLDLLVRITTANVGAFPTGTNPALITLTIAPTTGLMSGGFTLKDNDPTATGTSVLSRPGTFSGVIVNRVGAQRGVGFFLLQELPVLGPPKTTLATMPKLSGQVTLEATH